MCALLGSWPAAAAAPSRRPFCSGGWCCFLDPCACDGMFPVPRRSVLLQNYWKQQHERNRKQRSCGVQQYQGIEAYVILLKQFRPIQSVPSRARLRTLIVSEKPRPSLPAGGRANRKIHQRRLGQRITKAVDAVDQPCPGKRGSNRYPRLATVAIVRRQKQAAKFKMPADITVCHRPATPQIAATSCKALCLGRQMHLRSFCCRKELRSKNRGRYRTVPSTRQPPTSSLPRRY